MAWRTVLAGVVLFSLRVSVAWGVPVPTVGFGGWDGFGLESADLTYYFGTPTSDVPIDAQQQTLAESLDVWSSAVAITFSETSLANQVGSIDINFCPFSTCFPEVASNILAFAFLPPFDAGEPLAGDIFFNDDFRWEVGDGLGFEAFDLAYVGVHEAGHSLGLLHSDNPNSVMFPFTGPNTIFTGLHADDVAGIQSLYAPAANLAPVPEPSTLLLFGTAVGLGMLVRRRRRHTAEGDPHLPAVLARADEVIHP